MALVDPAMATQVQFCAGKLPLAMCNVVSICWCAAQIPKSALLLTGVYLWHLVYLDSLFFTYQADVAKVGGKRLL